MMAKFRVINDGVAVYISVEQHTTDEKKNILITSDMMSEGEIDGAVEYLIEEIKKSRTQAKKTLKRITDKNKKEGLYPT